MSDQTIRYDEEMVGAGHPTKADTLNRLALIEADSDGHGKVRFLKEQTAEPAVPDGEGALYTADDGGTCLYYKADGNLQELARPGQAPAPGYITGMQLSRASDNSISIQPGVCEMGGKLYVLPNAMTITVAVTTPLTWRGLFMNPPATGNVLSAANFGHMDSGNIIKSADGTKFIYSGYESYRVIGMYPTSDGVINADFRTANGLYYTYLEVINDSSPPTVVTSYNMGMPNIGENLIGQFSTLISADISTTKINFYLQNITVLGGEGNDHRGVTTGQSADGSMSLRAYTTGGYPILLLMYLMTVTIPTGMAR